MTGKFDKIRDISIIGSADIIGSVISAGFWFYIASIIDVERYGEINYFFSIAGIVSVISLIGITNSLVVFSAKNIKIQSTLYLISLSIGIISAIFIYFILDNFETGILVIGYIIFAIAYSDFLGKKKFKTYGKFILLQKSLMVIFGLSFYFILGDKGIVLGFGIALLIGISQIIIGFKDTQINFKLLREKWKFLISNYANSLLGAFVGTVDKIIIGSLFGFTVLGNYSLGLQFLALMGILPSIISRYLIPNESTGVENKKLKKYVIIISFFIGITSFVIGPEIIIQIFPKFTTADILIRILSLTIIPSAFVVTYHAKFLGNEKGHYLIFTGIIRIGIFFVGILFLGEIYDIIGIGISFLFAGISEVILCKVILKKWFGKI